MIFDHKYTVLDRFSVDPSKAKANFKEFHIFTTTVPGGPLLESSDYGSSFTIIFSYGPTNERWTFFPFGIRRIVDKGVYTVDATWYRMDMALWLQAKDWYENMALPSPEDLLNRTY